MRAGAGLAVFDLDGTLVPAPSTELRFALHLAAAGVVGPRQALRALCFAARWAPAYGRHVWKKNKGYLAGLAVDDVERRAAAYVERRLLRLLRPAVLARLRSHASAGDAVVLLTGSARFLARPLCRMLGVAHCIATDCAAEDGRYAFAPPRQHPFGADKLALLCAYGRRAGLPLGRMSAYADSAHDLPLLAAAAHAVAVHPDRALARAARARGWEILRA